MSAQPAQTRPAQANGTQAGPGHGEAYAFDARGADAGYVASSRSAFLSTLTPDQNQWRAALAVVLLSLVLFAAMVPFARVPLPPLPGFLPIYQSALVVVDLITMTLLLGQYAILKSRALLVLACAYLFGALMAVAHALSFPGLFAPAGLLGGGQTTAWLYFLWHAGFPLFVVGYALLKGREPPGTASRDTFKAHVASGIGLTLAIAALAVGVAHSIPRALPLMVGNADAQAKVVVAAATWLIGMGTLALLWRRRPHSVIDLWLMVVLCVWAADTALAAVFNNARYDVGWYAGRVYGLLASTFVLAVLLLENSMLYARLVEANEAQRRRAAELQRLSTDLEAANRDLDAFAGGLAHDLQQPITTIGAFAQVMQRQGGLPASAGQDSHLQRIINAAGAAHRMIRSLLEFARLGQKQIEPAPVDLNLLVREARNNLAADADAGTTPVRWTVGPLPVVHGDPSLLLLAVVNVLSNAVKYSRACEQPHVHVDGLWDAAGDYRLRISDNGIGFETAQAASLFRPFQRLHTTDTFEGTGMGLANVRRIMERHGGRVLADAAPGKGASFTLVFARARAGPG
ncbi:MAG: MASE4 domain-containing protein [Burkholderiales bacterium]|nr:MASE4 domain-containing protein [Burkholderiales bacterium]